MDNSALAIGILAGGAISTLARWLASSIKPRTNTPSDQKREPYRTPDTREPDDLSPIPEPELSSKPLQLSKKDLAINAAAKMSLYGCRHHFLPAPSEPGYSRCESCGIQATDGFAAEVNKQAEEEAAEKRRRAEFVQKHGYGVK